MKKESNYAIVKIPSSIQSEDIIHLQVKRIACSDMRITGVYLPSKSPNQQYRQYKHYLNDLQSHDNALLMGDVNICRYDDDDTYLPAENVNKGIKQIINSYAYVTARSPNGRQRPESCIDHIYTHGVDVVELGVVHTGISDHTLIFCTMQQENSDDVESEDTLQHDVPRLLAALVGSGPSLCEDMWVKSHKFWILARRMETKRIELSELIKGCSW